MKAPFRSLLVGAGLGLDVVVVATLLLIQTAQRWAQRGPLIDMDVAEWATVYVLQSGAMIAASVMLCRRPTNWSSRLVVVTGGVLLVARIAIVWGYLQIPRDRANVAIASEQLRRIDQRISSALAEGHEIPATIDALGLTKEEVVDPWGFRISYSRSPHGYRIESRGAPGRVMRDDEFASRLRLDRRLAEGPSSRLGAE